MGIAPDCGLSRPFASMLVITLYQVPGRHIGYRHCCGMAIVDRETIRIITALIRLNGSKTTNASAMITSIKTAASGPHAIGSKDLKHCGLHSAEASDTISCLDGLRLNDLFLSLESIIELNN